jgi:metallo-beta-lactamase class B
MPVTEAGKTYNVLFYCSTSVPGYKLLHNTYYPKIVSDYERSFQYAATLPCDVFLANHTGFFHMEEKLARIKPGAPNPFVDPSEYARYVKESHSEFESILARESRGG